MSQDQTAPGHVTDANRPKIFRLGDDATPPPPPGEEAATAAIAGGAHSRLPGPSSAGQRHDAGTTYSGPGPSVPTRSPSPEPTRFTTPGLSYPAQPPQNSISADHLPTQSIPDAEYPPTPSRSPSATGQSPVVEWLVNPDNRKMVIGGGALVVAGLFILAGSGVPRLIGVVVAVAIWVAFFRVAHTENGTFRMWTRLDAEEIAGLAAEECMNLSGPLSKVVLSEGSIERLDFVVTGAMSSPLEFHADLVRHNDGRTCITTSIDTWTRNRMTVWFIPVPFSKTIDGFRLYKRFGDHWTERIQHYDANASGDYLKSRT